MKKIERFKKKVNNYLFDHILLKSGLSLTKSALVCASAALLYSFAFVCFVTPAVVNPTSLSGSSVITGGVGGIIQVLHLILKLSGADIDAKLLQSICYFVFNIPILIFAFFKVGKRFAFLSLVNVLLSSVFIKALQMWDVVPHIVETVKDTQVTRVLFAGALIGLSSAIAFRENGSCGGIDIFSYFFAMRKSTNVGKYSACINIVIVTAYSILSGILGNGTNTHIVVLNIMFAIMYVFVCSLVVDFVNIRNKKAQIQIISENPSMSAILISNFPHSTTTVMGKGGYLHHDKFVVYMVTSSNEIKRAVKTARIADPQAFITVTPLIQAYGNFYIKPVE